jgi:glycine dehydrogenase subunit 1
MPFIPHTDNDVAHMLETLGLDEIPAVFDEIPANVPRADLSTIPNGANEMAITRLLQQREPCFDSHRQFIGAGSYQHHIPAIVWQLASRGEFYTAYTPYQAEASQGTLQVIYEYQSMMAGLMAMDVSNASLYDGASALAEAVLMAVRIKRSKATHILVPKNLNPRYRAVLASILCHHDITLHEVDFDATGVLATETLASALHPDVAALILPQPNFFGRLEAVDALTDLAHQHDVLVIGVVNPTACALIKPPGEWGQAGADIVCGEGQPLGVPMAGGGPYFGFMCCKKAYIRQLPGRIVGRTTDEAGRTGYTLTLQAREQHIRRAKATSNICTNQGLAVTAASIYMTLMGAQGLKQVAAQSHINTTRLAKQLQAIPGVEPLLVGQAFHEFVYRYKDWPAKKLLSALQEKGIAGGYDLSQDYPEWPGAILVCVTETKIDEDLVAYVDALASIEG